MNDIQIALHADTLNEAGFMEDTMEAVKGRVLHMYHTEGAGGGHAPDLIKSASLIFYRHLRTLPYLTHKILSMNI